MQDKWEYKLRRYISKHVPVLDVPGMRQSRRIEGQFSHKVEVTAYRAVMCYIQKGLGDCNEIASRVLNVVTRFQAGNERGDYHICLFSFGWNDGKLHHHGSSFPGRSTTRGGKVSKLLCEIAGTEQVDPAPVIPVLFPWADPYGSITGPTINDLLIFFCHDRSVKMSSLLEKKYTRSIKRHSIWVFVGGNNPEFELGTFSPEYEGKNNEYG